MPALYGLFHVERRWFDRWGTELRFRRHGFAPAWFHVEHRAYRPGSRDLNRSSEELELATGFITGGTVPRGTPAPG